MKSPVHGLSQLAPAIDLIASLAGVPGLSVGVIHQGDVIFQHNFGHGDLSAEIPTTSDTIYPIASLSKSFTSFLYGSLVHEGLADWDTPIRSVLPDFHSASLQVTMCTTPLDLLSHRSGIPGGESMYWHAVPLLNDSGIIPMFASLPALHQFRNEWRYNNLGYGLVGMVMSARTGQSYQELLQSRITEPLKLDRTGVSFDHHQVSDVAKMYLVTEEGEAVENIRPSFAPGSAMVAAGGIKSSVNDLLAYYGTMLQQLSPAPAPARFNSSHFSLKELATITSGKVFLNSSTSLKSNEKTILERSYGLGWIRTQLPGTLGTMGNNPWLVQMPVVNTSRFTLYHQGNLPGATCAVYLFPETHSGVVVLSNGYGLNDAPDWVAQLIAEALFDAEPRNDYVELAKDAAAVMIRTRLHTVRRIHELKRHDAIPPTSHIGFEGRYYNVAATFFIEIFTHEEHLMLAFQGLKEETFTLKYLDDDMYTFFTSTRELAKQGRHIYRAPYFLIRFQRDPTDKIIGLEWAHEGGDTGGELYMKNGFALSGTEWGRAAGYIISMGVMVLPMYIYVVGSKNMRKP